MGSPAGMDAILEKSFVQLVLREGAVVISNAAHQLMAYPQWRASSKPITPLSCMREFGFITNARRYCILA
jgi:hypothetical protein